MSRMLFRMFTDQTRMVFALAYEEAGRLGARTLGTEHLLLAILRLPDATAVRVLRELGVDVDELRAAVEFESGAGTGSNAEDRARGRARRAAPASVRDSVRDSGIVVVRAVGRAAMTPAARGAIALAVDEARRLKSSTVDAGHLLLGLLRQDDGIAATVLARVGVTLDQVAARLPRIEDAPAASAPDVASGPKTNVVTCRLDDHAVDALDALVEAGIRPTRSDAAAWLISTGIEAHRALFDRVHATVDEIRRLRLEAQTMVGQVDVCPVDASPGTAERWSAAFGHDEPDQENEGRDTTRSRRATGIEPRGE